MPLSTFLYPDGTANLDGSTAEDENPLISVVISINASDEPPDGAAVEADSCFSSLGASAFFLRPKPPKPPNLPPSTLPIDGASGLGLDCCAAAWPSDPDAPLAGWPSAVGVIFMTDNTVMPSSLAISFPIHAIARPTSAP